MTGIGPKQTLPCGSRRTDGDGLMSSRDRPSSPAPGLLIALTGEPGSGKTHVLAELAARQRARGSRTDGFLAAAGERRTPDEGASEYQLRMLASGETLPWAVRDETLSPPYRFNEITFYRLQDWANRLPPATPLVILDEFAKFEARGEGLYPVWPVICAQRPRIVVMAVRAGLAGAIEEKLGRRFDVTIDAEAPGALQQLEQICDDFGEWTRIGLFGGASGVIEAGLGSALHAAKIPFRSTFLSSLQGAMMVFAGFGLTQPGRVMWVSFISSGLKALSPAGTRLRPMLAIFMQGLLFGSTVQVLGWNVLAIGLGGFLIGLWASLQGFFLEYLMLGDDLIRAYDSMVLWLARAWHVPAPGLPWLVGGWAVVHGLVCATVGLIAWRLQQPPAALRRILEQEAAGATPLTPAAPLSRWMRLLEFTRWKFWLPLVIVAAILLAGGSSWEKVAWLSLRFVAVGLVFMAFVSLVRPARWAHALRKYGWWGPALAFSDAFGRRELPGDPAESADRPSSR
jgi:nucleoside-triphosphatase THEP1